MLVCQSVCLLTFVTFSLLWTACPQDLPVIWSLFFQDLPPPGQIKITSVAHDAVSLSWEPPEGLTESLRFRVTWKSESTGALLCSEVPVTNLCIQGLTPEVKYEFTVATISDSRGQSAKVVSTAQTTGKASKFEL